jgi:hypothetical protein
MKSRTLLPFLLAIGFQTSQTFPQASEQKPKVDITLAPKCGDGADSQGNIEGTVTGLQSPENYKIVLYAHTDKWYVQPLGDSPLTEIGADGKWSNWTHLGGRYAALVVPASFSAPADTLALPTIKQGVIANAEVSCKE